MAKEIIKKLEEVTNYDINLIEIDALEKLYSKYDLPPFHNEGFGEFHQGDASNIETVEAIDKINSMNQHFVIGYYEEEGEIQSEELFKFLKEEFEDILIEEAIKVKKEYWKEYYEEDIRDFLEDKFFHSGEVIGVDWSVFIDIDTGDIWEHTAPSNNWSFMEEDEDRKRIVHLNNYSKPFLDHTDLISEESKKVIEDNFWTVLPNEWDDMYYCEQVEWIEENCQLAVEEYNEVVREEAIERIIENLKYED